LIHGYSASGTSYAHPAVPEGLAKTLCDQGRDVWVLDMRSSAGMPTARGDWAFEDMARFDIPIAVEHVLRTSQAAKVDVVAHCMGSAMFGMALLADKDRHNKSNTLHEKIGRLVMSQVGPAMVMSPANVLRAYVMRYVRDFLPLKDYAFSPEGAPSVADQLLDRMLATLPMPADEYRRENPMWLPGKSTPWVGTRHRMDALYARTFSLANLSDEVLDQIDDFFGPLSVETVSQVIHFARFNTVTDRTGFNQYMIPSRIHQCLVFPMLSIHGEDNGLSDVATLSQMRDSLAGAGIAHLNDQGDDVDQTTVPRTDDQVKALIHRNKAALESGTASYMTWRIAGHGHQDCLIGVHAGEIAKVIAAYLARSHSEPASGKEDRP
jgi:cholesterol oxidase